MTPRVVDPADRPGRGRQRPAAGASRSASAWYVRDLQQTVVRADRHHVASVPAAQELEISIREVRVQFDRYLITGDRKHLEPVPRLQAADGRRRWPTPRRRPPRPAEQALMRRTRQGYDHFFAEYDKAARRTRRRRGSTPKIIELTDTVLHEGDPRAGPRVPAAQRGDADRRPARRTSELADRLTVGLVGARAVRVGRRAARRVGDRRPPSAGRCCGPRSGCATRPSSSTRPARAGRRPIAERAQPADALERVTVSVSAVLRRLRQTERDALRAEQLAWVGQMAAGIAHEVRNPLMAIKLLVQAAADRPRRAGVPAARPAGARGGDRPAGADRQRVPRLRPPAAAGAAAGGRRRRWPSRAVGRDPRRGPSCRG